MRSAFSRSFMLSALAIGVALRVVQAFRMPIIEHDGAMYAGLASAILRGDWAHGLSPLWPPLYPLMIAGLAAIAHAFGAAITPPVLEGSARAVSVLCGTAALTALYWFGQRLLGRGGAQWALILTLFHPRFVQFSTAALSEAPFTLMLLAGLAALMAAWKIGPAPNALPAPDALLEISRRRFILEIAAGASFALAYLIRPEGILIAAVLWAAGIVFRRGERTLARLSPVFAATVILVSAPFIIFLHAQLGSWSLGEKGSFNFWREYRSEYATVYSEPRGLSERASESPELAADIPPESVHLAGFIFHRPGAFLARYLRNLGVILASSFPVAVYHIFMLLAVLGVIGISIRRWWPILVVIAVFPLLYAAFSVDRRFFVPVIPLVLLLSARGMERLEARLTRGIASQTRAAWVAYSIAATLALSGLGYSLARGFIDDAPEHRAAGVRLGEMWREQRAAGGVAGSIHERPVVMSRKPWVAFYANGLIAELPEGSVEDVLARARAKGCDVLVIDERWVESTRPRLARLLDPAQRAPGMRVLYESDAARRIVLYDVSALR